MIHRMYKKEDSSVYTFIVKKDGRNVYCWLFYNTQIKEPVSILRNMPSGPIVKAYSVEINDLPSDMKHEVVNYIYGGKQYP